MLKISSGVESGSVQMIPGLLYQSFIDDPIGHPLNTPSAKIEITSEKYAETGGNPFPVYTAYGQSGRFRLITPHARNRINSQFMNLQTSAENRIIMNREDAGDLRIEEGGEVIVSSETGSLKSTVILTDEIIGGTVSMDCSYSGILTSTEPTLPSGGSRTHSTFVDIRSA